jgi:hypothetical protein
MKNYPHFYQNLGSSGFSYSNLMMDYGEHLYPGTGFGDCCFAAKNSLLNIDNEIGDDDQAKNYHRGKLNRFKDAMFDRIHELDQDCVEKRSLLQMVEYITYIGEFLKIREYEEENPFLSPEKLNWYPPAFQRLRGSLGNIDPQLRSDLEERCDIAIRWCQQHLETIAAPPRRSAQSPPEQRHPEKKWWQFWV